MEHQRSVMVRPSIDAIMMEIARIIAKRSTCSSRIRVGAVATYSNRIIATGYNGVPRGVPHCDDTGCQRGPDGKHLFLVHAEENVIINAMRSSLSLLGATVYVTHTPCSHCAALFVQVGVIRVVAGALWGETSLEAKMLLENQGILVDWSFG